MIIYTVSLSSEISFFSLTRFFFLTPPSRSLFYWWISHKQDVITGDEMISDSYKLKEVDGIAYEADCRNIQIGGEEFG